MNKSLKQKWDNQAAMEFAVLQGMELGMEKGKLDAGRKIKLPAMAKEDIARGQDPGLEDVEHL